MSGLKVSPVKTHYFFLAAAEDINPIWASDLWQGVMALNFGEAFEALSGCTMRARCAMSYLDAMSGQTRVLVCPADVIDGCVDDDPIALDFDVFMAIDLALARRENPDLIFKGELTCVVGIAPDNIFTGKQIADMLSAAATEMNHGRVVPMFVKG